jgi:hypothetical protein
MSESDLEVAAMLARALDVVDRDLTAMADIGADLWPPKIVEAMEQNIALRATMKRAVQLMPEHRDELKALYLEELGKAFWDESYVPPPILPETIEHLAATAEFLRRRRLMDSALDDACKREGL